jgi:hypothetical protein
MREHAVEHGLSYTFAKRFHGARWWTDRNWYLAIDLNHSDQRGPYQTVPGLRWVSDRRPGRAQLDETERGACFS